MANPFEHGFYESADLRTFGFARVGEGVRIAKNCTILGVHNISIGDDVRIDAHVCIVALGEAVTIGDHVHIGGQCHFAAQAGLTIGDFCGFSQGVKFYTTSDDYSGRAMIGPMVGERFTNVTRRAIHVGRHVVIGAGSILLPGADLGDSVAVGALSLVAGPMPAATICCGVPARPIRPRDLGHLALEPEFLAQYAIAAGRSSIVAA